MSAAHQATSSLYPRLCSAATTLLPLLLVGLLGAFGLPRPLHGDQALFMLGAQGMSAGKVLYVDFWDLKQPGVFLFHLAAGQLFGFSEVGLHLFELGYLLLFSALLMWTLRPTFATPWFSCLVPIATVGAYYVVAKSWHQTQLEMLVAFPLYLSLWLVSTPWPATTAAAPRLVSFWLLRWSYGGLQNDLRAHPGGFLAGSSAYRMASPTYAFRHPPGGATVPRIMRHVCRLTHCGRLVLAPWGASGLAVDIFYRAGRGRRRGAA